MSNPFDEFDSQAANPFDEFDTPSKGKTSFSEDFDIADAQVANTWSKAKGLSLGAVATAIGDTNTADEIYRDMEETTKARLKAANPKGKEQTFGGKAIGMLATLPAQLTAMPMSPFDTGQEMIESGESTGRAGAAAVTDAVFNAVGMGLPGAVGKTVGKKIVSGGVINALQDAASRKAISSIAETEEAKEKFKPTLETTALAAIPGAGIGGIHGAMSRSPKIDPSADFDKKLADAQAKPEAEVAKNPFDEFDNLKATEAEGAPGFKGQMALWDIDESARMRNPYEAVTGDWRIDENGIPVKVDLSMDARNTENILQRNLWGDELPPKHEQEAIPLTQAIDSMPDMPWRSDRDVGIELLKHEIEPSNELKTAIADIDRPIRTMGNKQRGAINPEVFKEGFEKLKQLADGTWLRAFSDGQSLTIEAIKDSRKMGGAVFEKTDKWDSPSNVDMAATMVGSKQKGLATEIYRFGSQLGNDIVPSKIRTQAGSAMWESFQRKGLASKNDPYIPRFRRDPNKYSKEPTDPYAAIKQGLDYIPKSQKGAVYFGRENPLEKVLGRDGTMIPKNPDPKEVLKAALAEGKDGGKMRLHESGSTSAWMKRGSSAIQGVGRILQNAQKAADLQIKKLVHPAENSLRVLKPQEMRDLQKTMMQEMLNGERLPLEKLEQLLSPKQLKAYAHLRKAFEDTLRIQNEARKVQGKKPITEMEAYLSSRWEGDFRRPLYEAVLDKNGNPKLDAEGNLQRKLVWYLAANTKRGLEAQTSALKKERPDLSYDPKDDHTVRYYKRETDLQSALTTILDILDRDDPAVARIQEVVKQQAMNESASFLGQEKHFKEKTGVRGFVGDRPGMDSAKEARAFFQQQIQYAKNAYKWSEIQKASDLVKEIVSDPDLIKQQPNNVAYIKDYVKNVVGYGESRVIAHAEDSIRGLGVSPAEIDKAIGSMKSFFILQKLFSIPYVVTNAIQTTTVMPYLLDIRTKYGVNSMQTAAAVPVGLLGGLTMAGSHYGKLLTNNSDNAFIRDAVKYMEGKWDAFRYAEDNGATARSIYDESPIETSFNTVGKIGNAMGKAIASPEVFVRSIAFMTYAHALKNSKKIKSDIEAFQIAEEYTNKSMVDYRASERPMLFSKLGIMGNFLNTLQTYPASFYNQWNYFAREFAKGNPGPFVAAFALQYALAGAMGLPYANDLFKMYEFLKDNLLSTKYWQKAQENKFLSNPKLWMMENFGSASVYGALSDKTGLGLTSRVTAPGVVDMVQAPGGPAYEIGKQAINIGKAALDPTNSTKVAQAVHSVAPVGLQGLIETDPMMEGITYEAPRPDGRRVITSTSDVGEHKGVYARSPEEMTMRKFGFRSQPEVVERELGYITNKNSKLGERKARDLVGTFYDAVKRGDKKEAKELYEVYTKITGNGISDAALEQQIKENYFTTMERATTATKSVTAMQNVKRMQEILKQIKEEHGK